MKFAIVGCGQIGRRHAEHISNIGTLQAVCDIKVDRAWDFQDKYDRNTVPYIGRRKETVACSSIDQLLKWGPPIDVFSICTPNYLHAEHTIKALKAGCHVICEKPMALNVSDCKKMILEADKANRYLFIVKQNRFNPPVMKVRQLIDEARLGKILSFQLSCFWNRNFKYYQNSDWRGDKEMDGGTLFTVFSHFIDLLCWMFGDVVEVHSVTKNFKHPIIVQFEDTGVAIIRFNRGTIGTINYTVNAYSKNMEGSLTIFGDKGTVKIGGQYLNELEYQDIEGYEIKDLPKGNSANDYGSWVGSMSNHDKVYENVMDVLTNGAKIIADGNDGLKTVELIEKIYQAVR